MSTDTSDVEEIKINQEKEKRAAIPKRWKRIKVEMSSDDSDTEDIKREEDEEEVLAISQQEESYRRKRINEIDFLKEKIQCTSCTESLMGKPMSSLAKHPLLGVLTCKPCFEFYTCGEFSVDEDGTDKYCRWCGQGGMLYICGHCCLGFCKACIMRNFNRSVLADVEKEGWKCFCCQPKPLWELRALCEAVFNTMGKKPIGKLMSEAELQSFPKTRMRLSSPIGSRASEKMEEEKGKKMNLEHNSEKEQKPKHLKRQIVFDSESEEDPKCSNRKSGYKSEASSSHKEGIKKSDRKESYEEKTKGHKLKHICNEERKKQPIESEPVLDEKSAEELCVELKKSVKEGNKMLSTLSESFEKLDLNINVENMIEYEKRKHMTEEIKKLKQFCTKTIQEAIGDVLNQYNAFLVEHKSVKGTCESEQNLSETEKTCKDETKHTEVENGTDNRKSSTIKQSAGTASKVADEATNPTKLVDDSSQKMRDISSFHEPVIMSKPEELTEEPSKEVTSVDDALSRQKEISDTDIRKVETNDTVVEKKSKARKKNTYKAQKNTGNVKNVSADDKTSEASKEEGNILQSKDAPGKDGEKRKKDGGGKKGRNKINEYKSEE